MHPATEYEYPNLDFEEWYQQGMSCYYAALPRLWAKQAFHALAKRWRLDGKPIERVHLRAFVLGKTGNDIRGIRSRHVRDGYSWPMAPDASWEFVVLAFPDGAIDLDFVHPVSRRFYSEDNEPFELPESTPYIFTAQWFEKMGFSVMRMMSVAAVGYAAPLGSHLQLICGETP